MSIFEFQELFGTEEKCQEHLFNMRFKDGFECPKCGCTHGYKISTRNSMKCSKCEYQLSAMAGTIFHNSKMPLVKWYLAIFFVTIDKRGISALQLQKEIGVTYKTAWYVNKRIREGMKNADEKYKLDGTVVVDETYFSGIKQPSNTKKNKPKKRGRGTKKNKVIVALSVDKNGYPLYAKMTLVNNFRAVTIAKFAKKNIEKGATILTDGFNSYKSQKLKKDYFHEFENFDKDNENSTLKWIHKVISNAKAFINGTPHGVEKLELQKYLDEFCYRFNRRHILKLIPEKLINSLLLAKPVNYYGEVMG